ncbi:hypothetical protein F8M49_29925 [Rhodococcus zopfii]|uniref:Uncharacterized protein n=1 Tax=Rhodococcus zopfii TaxID=43772 RepID=A0ABU3WX44_9NOCA|nr:hypothetical protein [Rhodococcus zopfii]MDV2478581.1 hypothetical protein [Rhodococcus zopfii]
MSTDFVPELITRTGASRHPAVPRESAEQQAARYFAASTRNHEMTVLHDDGVYRHIRCAEPGTGIWSWTLTTWPGHLCIDGDLESYTFARIDDMFEFFALRGGGINPSYWAEKITNRDAGRGTRKFSSEKAKAAVVADFLEQRHYHTRDTADVFRDLRYYVLDQIEHFDESEFYAVLNDWRYLGGWQFEDLGDWDVRDWDCHYLYACHAIAWGIAEYRKAAQSGSVDHKAGDAAPEAPTSEAVAAEIVAQYEGSE